MALLLLCPYLEGIGFIVRTDHNSLKWVLNLTEITDKLERWHLRISEFDFDVIHRAGIKHQAADTRSRLRTNWEDNTPLEGDLLRSAIKAIQKLVKSHICVGHTNKDYTVPFDGNGTRGVLETANWKRNFSRTSTGHFLQDHNTCK